MAEIKPILLEEYGGFIATIGDLYMFRWNGSPFYFTTLEEAVAGARENYIWEYRQYRRACPSKERAGRALIALGVKVEGR